MTIEVAGQELRLLPERAAYWVQESTLLIADAHFGKAASFRAAAVPVPVGTTDDNLRRLDIALQQTGANRVVCLGDLLHARAGRSEQTLSAVANWRARHASLEFCLVRGNHDRHAGDPPSNWHVQVVEEPVLAAPFVWRHQPVSHDAGYVLAGHVHPAVRVGQGQFSETVACFYFGPDLAVLPAFGDFTGTATLRPSADDRVYVLAGDEVIPLP